MNHLDGLNDQQKEAALYTKGPLLIIAGAGAGKTRTLTHRILHLINEGVAPSQILAITFTNKAAKELRDRIQALLAGNTWNGVPFASTFHSLGVYILRENAEAAGLSKNFSILDKSDSLSLLRRATKERGFDPKQFPPEKISAVISNAKAELINHRAFEARAGESHFFSVVASVWPVYERLCNEQKSVDFDDLIMKTVELFRKNPAILDFYQERWRYIHIDEYQDTNVSQYELSKLLAQKYKEICAVGDADQCIYTWRKADFRNILRFERDWPGSHVVLLEENYRSTQTILEAANTIISKNTARVPKKLFTKSGNGEKITIFQAFDEADEARFVVSTAKELISKGAKPTEICVLYRANYQSRVLEEQFLRAGVAYQLLGTRFFERKEVKDLVSYIKVALNPVDWESFKRAVATPSRGIGDTTIQKLIEGKQSELNRGAAEKVSQFRTILEDIAQKALELKPSELIRYAMKRSGIESELLKEGEEERLENMHELASLATKFDDMPGDEGIQKLITDAALAADQDTLMEEKAGVRLMTVHASKGLEFDYVFITGLEDGLFPHRKFDESADPEEERRLFYVALTRARAKLHLSWTISRLIFGQRQYNQPSEFLADIHDGLTENIKKMPQSDGIDQSPWEAEDSITWDALR